MKHQLNELDLYYDRWPSPAPIQYDSVLDVDLRSSRPVRNSAAETELLEQAVAAYRCMGFPYPTWTDESLIRDIELIREAKTSISGRDIKQSYVGSALASAFHPSMYSVRCNGRKTPLEIFENDSALRRAILQRIRFGDHLKPHSIRRVLLTAPGCQAASNFRPTAACSLIREFKATSVLDFCMGWGGRLLGAIAAGVQYVGIDPHTKAVTGNKELLRQIRRTHRDLVGDVTLIWGCAEDVVGRRLFSPDLILTSPPYFDTELYSSETTQSYLRHPTTELWFEDFLGACIHGSFRDLRPGGHLVLNVSHQLAPRTLELATSAGFEMIRSMNLIIGSRPSHHSKGYKHEPVLVFRKSA